MKTLRILALLAIAGSASAATVQVKVDGVRNDKGIVQVALCDEATYPKDCRLTASAPAKPGAVTVDLPNVPAGTWAALAYHDENSDKKLNTNFVGMPKEGYGFSNGVKGTFGPPRFKDTAITVGEGATNATITLKY